MKEVTGKNVSDWVGLKTKKIGLGGGCYWCTEAVFQSLKGVAKVEQGYIASTGANDTFSEAVIVHFNEEEINLRLLIEIHLHTHKSTSDHSMRDKYRSAVYWFNEEQKEEAILLLKDLQQGFSAEIITKVYPFHAFEASRDDMTNYYHKNPEKPFCQTYIYPKLVLLLKQFSNQVKIDKLEHLKQYKV